MLIPFLIATVWIGLVMSFIWSSRGATNCLIKAALSIWTVWGLVMLFAAVWPLVQNGQIKVF